MREILFRGKRIDGLWVEGAGITVRESDANILSELGGSYGLKWCQVYPETVGQYTGLTDKNGKKIFEGDIIKIPDDFYEFGHNAGEIYEVYFCCGGFRLKPKYTKARGYWLEDDETVEVIGNIHDNQELLEVSHE